MEVPYSILTPRRSFMVIENGSNYFFFCWLFKDDSYYQATTEALISDAADALVVMDWGTEKATGYTPEEVQQKMKKLPPWKKTRYLYVFNFHTEGEILDLLNGTLLRGEKSNIIRSAVDWEIIVSLSKSSLAEHKLWTLNLE
jgi:hypothetical protein